MDVKYKNKKTIRPKNTEKEMSERNKLNIPIPAKVVADITDSSESMVKQIRRGAKEATGKKGQQIAKAEELLAAGSNALIEAVKEVVKL